MADPRGTLLTPDEQRLAAELMAAVDVRKLGGGDDGVDRSGAPLREDIDPGTLLSTVHSGSHTLGEAIGAAPLPADYLEEIYAGHGIDLPGEDGAVPSDDLNRGSTSDGRLGEDLPGEGESSRGPDDGGAAGSDRENDPRTGNQLDNRDYGSNGAEAGAFARTGGDDGVGEATGAAGGTTNGLVPGQHALGSEPLGATSFDPDDADGETVNPTTEQTDATVDAFADADEETVDPTTEQTDVTVDAVADAPTLTVNDVSGNEDSAIALDISAALTDTGESLAVTISGVPTGASLSAGTDNGDGTWTLTQAQLGGLTLTPPANSDTDFSLTVTATSTDGSDTAQSVGTIDVTVEAVADAPTLTVSDVSGNEDSAIALDI